MKISLWLPGIRRTRYRISCRLLFWVLVPTHVSPFWRFVWQGVFLASAAAYYGIIDQKCWLLFACHCREARCYEQKDYSWENSTKLRNGKRAACNHGVMDARGRLLSAKEA